MIVLIDGYNLLKQIFPGHKGVLTKQRSLLIRQLASYRHAKAQDIHQLIVVFDAGPSTHATRTVQSEVVVVFSGTKTSADDWIIDWVTRHRVQQIMVITLDRLLRETVEKLGADWMGVFDFYKIVQSVLSATTTLQKPSLSSDIKIYDRDNLDDEGDQLPLTGSALDELMEQASFKPIVKPDDRPKTTARKGSSYTPSKTERQIATKIKKLS